MDGPSKAPLDNDTGKNFVRRLVVVVVAVVVVVVVSQEITSVITIVHGDNEDFVYIYYMFYIFNVLTAQNTNDWSSRVLIRWRSINYISSDGATCREFSEL